MTAPALTVEVAFGSGWSTLEGSRTWTDVTTYVQHPDAVVVALGRSDELSTAGPNTLSLALDNTDGRFTPGNTGGAYSPDVKIGTPIRVKATPSGGSAVVRFTGYVDEWAVAWPGVTDAYAETRVTASSRLARGGLSRTLRSIVEEEYLFDGPAAYYTFGEAEGATFASDTSGHGMLNLNQAGEGTAVTFGTATGPGTDGLTAATFAGGQYLSGGLLEASSTVALEVFFSLDSAPSTSANLIQLPDATGYELAGIVLAVSNTGVLAGRAIFGASSGTSAGGATDVADGATHHAVLVYASATGTLDLYVDEVLDGTATTGVATTLEDSPINVGGGTFPATNPPWTTSQDSPFTGVIAHAAAHNGTLSTTRIAAHADAGLTGFLDETPGARIERYASYAGVPAAEFDADTGTPPMAHVDTTDSTPLDMMRKVETAEGGVLFDGQDGHHVFQGRGHRYDATVAFTFNVASGHVQPDYAARLDRSALVNVATAETTDGTVRTSFVDDTSRDSYGDHVKNFALMTTDTDDPAARAGWEVGVHAEPSLRVTSLTVELGKFSAANQASILALTVGDRVAVTNLMTQAPNSSEEFYVEGYRESAQGVGGRHTITFNVTPAAVSDVWLLEDATYGVLDSTTKLAY